MSNRTRTFTSLSLPVLLAAFTAPALAQNQFTFTDLGNLGTGGTVLPQAINSSGVAVGRAPFAATQRPFIWSPGQGMQIVPGVNEFAVATGINDDGVVVGTLGTSNNEAFRVSNAGFEPLGFLPGDISSGAVGITSRGGVIGNSFRTTSGNSVSTFLGQNGSLQSLLSGARSIGVSPGGIVVGTAGGDAFSFDGSFVNLGTPGAPGEFDVAEAADANDSGIVVGRARVLGGFASSGRDQAYVWMGGGAIEIPVPESSAVAVNAHGLVVGNSDQGPFQYDVFTGQVSFLAGITATPGNVELLAVEDINDQGQILGSFRTNFASTRSAFILDPVAVGAAYCTTNPNSTGVAASISAAGSDRVSVDQLVLRAASVPNSAGIFFFGTERAFAPLADGNICVGGAITRLGPVVNGSGNRASLRFDVQGNGTTAGAVFNFQYWFRDQPGGSGINANLTDAVEVSFRS